MLALPLPRSAGNADLQKFTAPSTLTEKSRCHSPGSDISTDA
jgi:hypothetical protein